MTLHEAVTVVEALLRRMASKPMLTPTDRAALNVLLADARATLAADQGRME